MLLERSHRFVEDLVGIVPLWNNDHMFDLQGDHMSKTPPPLLIEG